MYGADYTKRPNTCAFCLPTDERLARFAAFILTWPFVGEREGERGALIGIEIVFNVLSWFFGKNSEERT